MKSPSRICREEVEDGIWYILEVVENTLKNSLGDNILEKMIYNLMAVFEELRSLRDVDKV